MFLKNVINFLNNKMNMEFFEVQNEMDTFLSWKMSSFTKGGVAW